MESIMGNNDNNLNRRMAAMQTAIVESGISPHAVAEVLLETIMSAETELDFNRMLGGMVERAIRAQKHLDEIDASNQSTDDKIAALTEEALNATEANEGAALAALFAVDSDRGDMVKQLRQVARDMLPPGERPWEKGGTVHKVGKMGAARAAARKSDTCDCPKCLAEAAGTMLIMPSEVGEA
jgi:hypothetical protein